MTAIMSVLIAALFHGSRSLHLSAGQMLFHTQGRVACMFMVETGMVHLCRHLAAGGLMVLQRAGPGMVLAEASAYSDHYHCDARASVDGTVLALPKPAFLDALARDAQLSRDWAARLARGVQAARFRSEIRSLTRVADRLDAWLGEGNMLPEKGYWQDVADELGVTREALYRELARRRKTCTPAAGNCPPHAG